MLNKIPAIVLIVEDKTRDAKFIRRVKMLADEYGIYLTFITPEDLSRK